MSTLVQCSSCGRHVRVAESACPFCDALVTTTEPGALPASRARRAVAFAATLTVAACTPAATDTPPSSTPTTTTTTTTPTAAASGTAATPVSDDGPRPSRPSAPAARYGLPPFLADDDFV